MDLEKFFIETMGFHDETLLAELVKSSVYKKVPKGEVLVHQGEIQTSIPLIVSGAFQGSFYDEYGGEIIDFLAARLGGPVVGSSILGFPSSVEIKALIESEAVFVPVDVVSSLMQQCMELGELYVKLSLVAVEEQRDIKQMLYQCDAVMKYEWFRRRYSAIADKLTQKTVASFLGVSESWLSKIKKKM